MLKIVGTATAVALFAIASVALAQGVGASSGASGGASSSGATAGATGSMSSKCLGLLGAERDKCLREQGIITDSASGGGTASGSVSGSTDSASGSAGASAGASGTASSKCLAMIGEERAKCLREERAASGGASVGGTAGGTTPGTTGPGSSK